MSNDDQPELDPDILEMVADELGDRATTLHAEAQRTADNADELREMAKSLREANQ